MKIPKLDIRELFTSAVVVVVIIALLQYFGGLLVTAPGQIDPTGLAIIGILFVLISALIAIITANTSLPTPDWATGSDE
ncbi:hypothetical protein J2751_000850 [Halorubrum alkaliphilum]|uniref:Uncharacterized protein n=1 Tax=Halorubrum alkaliphilum TaxID=261290 RepID=A0A8T4GCL6_9EURY|nr:hypothetical protein [Halorubrum alkaliphilum]MBP1921853.1 hypothetical protein [Halorubrum alkaliphilum]